MVTVRHAVNVELEGQTETENSWFPGETCTDSGYPAVAFAHGKPRFVSRMLLHTMSYFDYC